MIESAKAEAQLVRKMADTNILRTYSRPQGGQISPHPKPLLNSASASRIFITCAEEADHVHD
jgi:hypothetical protein